MAVLRVTEQGEEHGLVKTVANSVAFDDFKHMSPETKAKAEKLKKEESRIVKARYLNKRGNNERLTKPYCRWAGEPIHTYHLIPGETYDLPMGFITEVNDPKKRVPKRSGLLDKNGNETHVDGVGEQIHELVPVGF